MRKELQFSPLILLHFPIKFLGKKKSSLDLHNALHSCASKVPFPKKLLKKHLECPRRKFQGKGERMNSAPN